MVDKVFGRPVPVLPLCCWFVPLRLAAFLIAVWMFSWNIANGLTWLTYSLIGVDTWILIKICGIVFILLAIISFYGAYGVWMEIPRFVDRFTIIFFWSVVINFLIQLIIIIIIEVEIHQAYNAAINACKQATANVPEAQAACNNVPLTDPYLGSMIARILIGVIVQSYLFIVIRSYNIELRQKAESGVQLGVTNPFQATTVQQPVQYQQQPVQYQQQPVQYQQQPVQPGYPTDYNKQHYGP